MNTSMLESTDENPTHEENQLKKCRNVTNKYI